MWPYVDLHSFCERAVLYFLEQTLPRKSTEHPYNMVESISGTWVVKRRLFKQVQKRMGNDAIPLILSLPRGLGAPFGPSPTFLLITLQKSAKE